MKRGIKRDRRRRDAVLPAGDNKDNTDSVKKIITDERRQLLEIANAMEIVAVHPDIVLGVSG